LGNFLGQNPRHRIPLVFFLITCSAFTLLGWDVLSPRFVLRFVPIVFEVDNLIMFRSLARRNAVRPSTGGPVWTSREVASGFLSEVLSSITALVISGLCPPACFDIDPGFAEVAQALHDPSRARGVITKVSGCTLLVPLELSPAAAVVGSRQSRSGIVDKASRFFLPSARFLITWGAPYTRCLRD